MTMTADEAQEWHAALFRQVLGLWQTAMLRLSRLRVVDEVENGLAYYRYTFLGEVPRLYQRWRASSPPRTDAEDAVRLPAFFRMGSWIGGDRDGNPFVTADTLRYAIRAQAGVAIGHFLDEVHRLGAELSLSTRLVKPTDALLALAQHASDASVAPAGRAVSAGADRRLRAAGDDGARARAGVAGETPARRPAGLRIARGVRGRSRGDRRVARRARRVRVCASSG